MFIAGLDLSISSSGVVIEEVDDDFIVKKSLCFGFTQKKKYTSENILYYNNKEFKSDYQKYIWMCDKITGWCEDCEYIAVEDYAYGKNGSSGMIFNLAEFEGNIKINLARNGKKLRFYAVNQIKKFFSQYGLADKITMKRSFDSFRGIKPDIAFLPEVNNGHGVSPTSDIVDATAIVEMLRKELRLKAGLDDIKSEPKFIRECFLNDTKAHPDGLLSSQWIEA